MFEREIVDAMWKKALDNWGLVQIAVPVQDPKSEALAYIDLNTRQVVINPDAHSTGEFDGIVWGIDVARRAGATKDRILNCLSLIEVKKFLARKRR